MLLYVTLEWEKVCFC